MGRAAPAVPGSGESTGRFGVECRAHPDEKRAPGRTRGDGAHGDREAAESGGRSRGTALGVLRRGGERVGRFAGLRGNRGWWLGEE